MVVHACNPFTPKAEAKGPRVCDKPALHSEFQSRWSHIKRLCLDKTTVKNNLTIFCNKVTVTNLVFSFSNFESETS